MLAFSDELIHEVHHGRVVRCFASRPRSLADCLAQAVARAPQSEAVVDGSRRLTYRQLDEAVQSLAAALAEARLAKGERIAILLGNRLEYQVIVLACALGGWIAVPLNLRLSKPEIAQSLEASGAAALFHEAEVALPDLPAVLVHRFAVSDDAPLPAAAPRQFDPVDEDEAAVILFTSGTTGKPKGAVLTHCNVVHSLLHFRRHYDLREGERCLLAVPASHVTGLVALLGVSVGVAGCLVIMREFKAAKFVEIAGRERMTYTLIVPAMVALILMQPDCDRTTLPDWRVCGFGGAPMPDATIAEIAARLPGLALHNTYGATETSSPAVIMPAQEAAARSRQIGLPVACCDLIVMDPQGREVPRGEQGEIWMAGPMVSPGYWNDPAATEAAYAHGFWKSGDIGAMDRQGYVSLHDRLKDMINRGGFKVWSVEVENTLCAHPAVLEAAVVGKSCPVLGERVVAFVHLCEPATADALRAHVTALLSDYKVPEDIHIEALPLPRNANGKLLKRELRERLALN
jgi:acyl-CoA synthetase (AMP-forming)/AMP-acid ligase II